jgi:hypothetical protein
LEFDLPATTKPLQLTMRLAGLTNPELLPVQLVEVHANGRKVAEWLVGSPAEHHASIPNRVLKENGKLRLELRAPKATTPRVLRISNDPRILGVKVHDVVITEATEDEGGTAPVSDAAGHRTL